MTDLAYLDSLFDVVTGNVFYVDSGGGNDNNKGTNWQKPLATVSAAVAKCNGGKGDYIYLAPGHAETLTASLALNVAGISIVGLGSGGSRAQITGNGTIDTWDVTGANIRIQNVEFPAPLTDAATAHVNVGAAGCSILGCVFHGSATGTNMESMITVAAAGDDCTILNCRLFNRVVICNSGISVDTSNRVEIGYTSILCNGEGWAVAALEDVGACKQLTVHHCVLKQFETDQPVIDFTGASIGTVWKVMCSGRIGTIASNVTTGAGDISFIELRVTEEPAKSGLIGVAPAVDA